MGSRSSPLSSDVRVCDIRLLLVPRALWFPVTRRTRLLRPLHQLSVFVRPEEWRITGKSMRLADSNAVGLTPSEKAVYTQHRFLWIFLGYKASCSSYWESFNELGRSEKVRDRVSLKPRRKKVKPLK